MQGRLRETPLSVSISTKCAHCAHPLHINVTSDLKYHVTEETSEPLVFQPFVDFDKLTEPSIINDY
ncbi:MAG: hypothetical protein GY940_46830 [bacterium]|nr:hypothetical protein [bacterium]